MIAARAANADKGRRDFDFSQKEFFNRGKKFSRSACCDLAVPGVDRAHPRILAVLVSDDLDITPLGQHGGKRPGAGRPRKGEVRPPKIRGALNRGSNRRDYLLARLTRDANDGVKTAAVLLQGVRDGVISVFAAGAEMSYCKRREPNGRGSENMARARDWKLYKLLNPRRPDQKAAVK